MKKKITDGSPKKLFLIMTFGFASSFVRKVTDNLPDAEACCREIKATGGAPKIYRCVLVAK